MSSILIAGGSGLLGTRLTELLLEKGHEVRHLSRRARTGASVPTFQWNIHTGEFDPAALAGVDYVVHLAGAGIADARWTESRKQLIIKSRTESTRLLKQAIAEHGSSVKAYLAGSAIGYYGDRGGEILTEEARPGSGFMPHSVQLWEEAIAEIPSELKLPTLVVRTGIVLSTQGGALPKMTMPLNFFTSVFFGDGQQWYSWIHIDDLCAIFVRAIEEGDWEGVYNGVAPHPARNKDFAQGLIDASGKPALLLPAPAFALRLALGEMSHTVLDSTRCSADKLLEKGFAFQYPELVPALKDLL